MTSLNRGSIHAKFLYLQKYIICFWSHIRLVMAICIDHHTIEDNQASFIVGWCIWVFVVISGFLLVTVNSKLASIVRYSTRGGNIQTLSPGVFWANRPSLLLPVIKFLLFFVSYVYANAIFFASQFGTKSCFFSRAGFQGQPIPWWVRTSFQISVYLQNETYSPVQ